MVDCCIARMLLLALLFLFLPFYIVRFIQIKRLNRSEYICCCCAALLLGLGSMWPQCIEFRARYRLYACSRAHVLLHITLYCFFLFFGCLPSSAEHVPCAWISAWPPLFPRTHTHTHDSPSFSLDVLLISFFHLLISWFFFSLARSKQRTKHR